MSIRSNPKSKAQHILCTQNRMTTMSVQSKIKIIFGAAGFGRNPADLNKEYLDLLARYNVVDLDTASLYTGSEKALGELDAPSKFIIHTKAPGFRPGVATKASILNYADQSLKELKTDSVEIYYLHSPDATVPLEETLDAVQEVYKDKRFKKFGLSNFKPEDVRKAYDYCRSKGYVLPSIYQGNYNPIARHYEKILFPLLRELKISFYAYSPIAGGFLCKSPETIKEGKGTGRWDPKSTFGHLYLGFYNTPLQVQALAEWQAIAEEAGISKAALAYRWVTYNSILKPEHGDGIIVGASAVHQLEETLKSLDQGPLPESVVTKIDRIWELVKDEAHVDNYHGKL